MTAHSIDQLLDGAKITPSSDSFDVATGLRRLAADVARASRAAVAESGPARSGGERRKLEVISRWVLSRADAAALLLRLVDDPGLSREAAEDRLDIEGALVYASLLYLTGHRESAQFWWQLTAGSGHRTAAYCLYLHHSERGEVRESRHWMHEATRRPSEPEAAPPVEDFYGILEVFAQYSRRHVAGSVPSEPLEAEVDRLAAGSPYGCGIVARPDRRLAERLHAVTPRT